MVQAFISVRIIDLCGVVMVGVHLVFHLVFSDEPKYWFYPGTQGRQQATCLRACAFEHLWTVGRERETSGTDLADGVVDIPP